MREGTRCAKHSHSPGREGLKHVKNPLPLARGVKRAQNPLPLAREEVKRAQNPHLNSTSLALSVGWPS